LTRKPVKSRVFSLRNVQITAGKSEPERPEQHDLAGAGAFLFFLQEPEHFRKLEWSRSWHKLLRLQAPAVFKNFVKSNDFC